MRGRAERLRRAIVRARAEVLTAAAFVAGWALLTWGVAALTRTWEVWPLSGGLLLLGLGGLRLFATMTWHGLYKLTRGAK